MIKPGLRLSVVGVALVLIWIGHGPLPGQTPAPIIVENPETPKYVGKEAPELIFKKEFSIPLPGRRYSFDVDDSGNIYLLESLAGRIFVYDKDGRLKNEFGKKGQGPGEFEIAVFLAVSKDRRIHVMDRIRRTIQIFDAQGKWLEGRLLPSVGMMNSLRFDSRGFAYVQNAMNLFALKDKERIRRGVGLLGRLSKYDRSYEKFVEIQVWDSAFVRRASIGGYNFVLYHDVFYYQAVEDDSLYYGNSSAYEIRRMNSEGQVTKIIRKKGARLPTTKKDQARLIKNFPELERLDTELARTKPFFFDFHVLDKIGLLVGTYEDEWNDQGTLTCDLFDLDGVYIAKVKVPGYLYAKDQDNISEQRHRIFKNGRCYSLVYNEKDEALELVRHSVELKWPPGKSNRAIFRGG
jgi:hypothetical protein